MRMSMDSGNRVVNRSLNATFVRDLAKVISWAFETRWNAMDAESIATLDKEYAHVFFEGGVLWANAYTQHFQDTREMIDRVLELERDEEGFDELFENTIKVVRQKMAKEEE